VHTAAWFREYYQPGGNDPAQLQRVNVDAVERLLEAAADADVPVMVHISSATTIGTRPGGRPSDEGTPPDPGWERCRSPVITPPARNARKQAPLEEPPSVRLNVLFSTERTAVLAQSNRPVQGATTEPAPAVPRHEAIERGERSVHEWHVTQPIRLGIPGPLARRYAGGFCCSVRCGR